MINLLCGDFSFMTHRNVHFFFFFFVVFLSAGKMGQLLKRLPLS